MIDAITEFKQTFEKQPVAQQWRNFIHTAMCAMTAFAEHSHTRGKNLEQKCTLFISPTQYIESLLTFRSGVKFSFKSLS